MEQAIPSVSQPTSMEASEVAGQVLEVDMEVQAPQLQQAVQLEEDLQEDGQDLEVGLVSVLDLVDHQHKLLLDPSALEEEVGVQEEELLEPRRLQEVAL